MSMVGISCVEVAGGRPENCRPGLAAEGGQGVGERGGPLGGVPGSVGPGRALGVDEDVPLPDGGVEPAGEGDDALRPVADPGLRVLDTDVLLEGAVGVFNGPAVGVEAG